MGRRLQPRSATTRRWPKLADASAVQEVATSAGVGGAAGALAPAGAGHAGAGHAGTGQVGTGQVGAGQVGAGQVGAGQADQQQRRRADFRDTILEAARRIIDEQGLQAATTRNIAELAGCAEGTIYRHFEDKHDLFLELLAGSAPEFLSLIGALPCPRRHRGTARHVVPARPRGVEVLPSCAALRGRRHRRPRAAGAAAPAFQPLAVGRSKPCARSSATSRPSASSGVSGREVRQLGRRRPCSARPSRTPFSMFGSARRSSANSQATRFSSPAWSIACWTASGHVRIEAGPWRGLAGARRDPPGWATRRGRPARPPGGAHPAGCCCGHVAVPQAGLCAGRPSTRRGASRRPGSVFWAPASVL